MKVDPPRRRPDLGLVLVLILGAAIRWGGLAAFPDFNTQDSGDYFVGSAHLAAGRGFAPRRIGEWRAPGYVVFLAAIRRLAGSHGGLLMAIQALVGLGAVAASWHLGKQLAGRGGALVLSLYFAVHPAYLLFEHTLQAESLGLALLVTGTALALRSAAREAPLQAFVAGLTLAAAMLTRANFLPFVGVLVAGLLAGKLLRAVPRRLCARWAVAVGLGLATLLAPWLIRQQRIFGRPSITLNVDRCRLVYLAQHGLFDPAKAAGEAAAWVPGQVDSIFPVIEALGSSTAAEIRAETLVHRQLEGLGARLRWKRLRAMSVFAGLPNYEPPAAGRHDVRYWFLTFVRDPGELFIQRRAQGLPDWLLATRLAPHRPTAANRLWSRTGDLTLRLGRPLGLLAAIGASFVLAGRLARRRRPPTAREWLGLTLFAAQIATALLHGWYLADYDRFAVLFDWVPVAVVLSLTWRVPREAAKA